MEKLLIDLINRGKKKSTAFKSELQHRLVIHCSKQVAGIGSGFLYDQINYSQVTLRTGRSDCHDTQLHENIK